MERDIVRQRARGAPLTFPAADRIVAASPAESICSGALGDCGRWLAARLLSGNVSRLSVAVQEQRLEEVTEQEAALLTTKAFPEDERQRRERLVRILVAEAAFAERVIEVASTDAVANCIHEHRLDWVTFDLEGLRLPSMAGATEARLLIREDGLSLSQVGELAGVSTLKLTILLEAAPPHIAAALSAAVPGDLVGPTASGAFYDLWLVHKRTPPDPADPVFCERARAELITGDVQRTAAGRITWRMPI